MVLSRAVGGWLGMWQCRGTRLEGVRSLHPAWYTVDACEQLSWQASQHGGCLQHI
jgi:hypothetical protein